MKMKILFVGKHLHFALPIIEKLRRRHEVRSCGNKTALQAQMQWADITWFEFCDDMLAYALTLPKSSLIVCRLHSYEAFTAIPLSLDWTKVDLLIFVSATIQRILEARKGTRLLTRTVVIGNGIDTDRFKPAENKPSGKKIASIGYINYKKNPGLMLYCFKKIHEYDPDYSFHIAGRHQDLRIKLYFEQFLKRCPLPLQFEGWVSDVPDWLQDKDYVISTSYLESFHSAVAEGMACGLVPLVHSWEGADRIYPTQWIFDDPDGCLDIIKRVESMDREKLSKQVREYAQLNFDAADKTDELIHELVQLQKKNGKFDSASYWEARYAGGGHSGAGSYGHLAEFKARTINKIICDEGAVSLIDHGCGDGNQASLIKVGEYYGLDVSPTAVEKCRKELEGKQFFLYEEAPANLTADIALSMDVIYHLVEDHTFDTYMKRLFTSAKKLVVIYSSDTTGNETSQHMRNRKFTDWIAKNQPEWKCAEVIQNEFPFDPDKPNTTSISSFYIFKKAGSEGQDALVPDPA